MTDENGLGSGQGRAGVTVESRRDGHRGFLRLETIRLTHPLFSGGRSAPLSREVLRSGPAVVALPYDPVLDTVLLVEQFRIGAFAAGAAAPWTIETVAGHVDAGEAPEDAARRETLEEADVTLTTLEPVGAFYSTPGTSDEILHGFIGRADLSRAGGTHGLASEGEDIRVFTVPFKRAMDAMDAGEINAGPLMVVLMALALRRERLRVAWR